jgi:hypothetical protein
MSDYDTTSPAMRAHIDRIVQAGYHGALRAAAAEHRVIVADAGLTVAEAVVLADLARRRLLALGYIDLTKLD